MLMSTPSSTLFPYTTLFRSVRAAGGGAVRQPGRLLRRVRRGQARLLAALAGHPRVHRPRPPRRLDQESGGGKSRSEEHTSELQSHSDLVCRLLLEKKKQKTN